MLSRLKIIVLLSLILFGSIFNIVQATQSERVFNVSANYDISGRTQISTQLIRITNNLYFYVDKDWYNNFANKNLFNAQLYNLASDFEYKTYPTLTNLLGSEDKPGLDNDPRIVIVLEALKDGLGGYVQSIDQYPRTIYQNSNEGQIIFLNANFITNASLDFLNYELAHEFTHLITLKQKPGAETWFYELISEFAGSFLGYDADGKITKQRAQNLLSSTEINLRDWKNSEKDYGKIKLLGLYLEEQFGNQFFAKAVKFPFEDGILSLDGALQQINANNSFSNVFLDWLIANIVNDCEINVKYCYQSPVLNSFSVISYIYYLPTQSQSSLSVKDSLKSWVGKWQKISGGQGVLQLKFTVPEATPIHKIAYIIEDYTGAKTIGFFDFSKVNTQDIYINDMGSQNIAVYFIPFVGAQDQGEEFYYYSWEATTVASNPQVEQQIIFKLQRKIEELQRQIASLQLQLAMLKNAQNISISQDNLSCSLFVGDLFYGMTSGEVKCLQRFLVDLGSDIYPEKLITGYYGPLTQAAVKRYQILKGITATGYFGPLTRTTVNQNF